MAHRCAGSAPVTRSGTARSSSGKFEPEPAFDGTLRKGHGATDRPCRRPQLGSGARTTSWRHGSPHAFPGSKFPRLIRNPTAVNRVRRGAHQARRIGGKKAARTGPNFAQPVPPGRIDVRIAFQEGASTDFTRRSDLSNNGARQDGSLTWFETNFRSAVPFRINEATGCP